MHEFIVETRHDVQNRNVSVEVGMHFEAALGWRTHERLVEHDLKYAQVEVAL